MKKFMVVALLAVGSFAIAASTSVPWFTDNAPVDIGVSPTVNGQVLSMIAFHNNTSTDLEVRIDYYAANGLFLDYATSASGTSADERTTRNYVWDVDYNTFVIGPNSTTAWRPYRDDPGAAAGGPPGGQESATGVIVPNRPDYVEATGFAKKKNGAIVLTWSGAKEDAGGRYQEYGLGVSAAFLLP